MFGYRKQKTQRFQNSRQQLGHIVTGRNPSSTLSIFTTSIGSETGSYSHITKKGTLILK